MMKRKIRWLWVTILFAQQVCSSGIIFDVGLGSFAVAGSFVALVYSKHDFQTNQRIEKLKDRAKDVHNDDKDLKKGLYQEYVELGKRRNYRLPVYDDSEVDQAIFNRFSANPRSKINDLPYADIFYKRAFRWGLFSGCCFVALIYRHRRIFSQTMTFVTEDSKR